MTISAAPIAASSPAYLLRLSCLAASVADDPNAGVMADTDYFSNGTYTQRMDDEQKQMMLQLEKAVRTACPQRKVTPGSVRSVLRQYSQVMGMAAAQAIRACPGANLASGPGAAQFSVEILPHRPIRDRSDGALCQARAGCWQALLL